MRTALTAAALVAGTILGLNLDYPCTGGGCATTHQTSAAHPCTGGDCLKPPDPTSDFS